jgi:hypothetical protein
MNCRVCGSELPEGAMFCGECGNSVTATRVTRPAVHDSRPSDTTILDPLPGPAIAGPAPTVRSVPLPDAFSAARRDESAASHQPGVFEASGAPREPVASDRPSAADEPAASRQSGQPAAFTLSFSTGERVSITGSGLLGRRPIAQPGEDPEHMVAIADTGRSVSKTHLEFGVEAGEFWICDRYSGNGTVVVPPSGAPRRSEPGRRYRVERGARVEIGDQYFDLN